MWLFIVTVAFASLRGLLDASDVERQAKMTTCELIKDFGFSCETTEATTEDGYILEVDRVGTLAKEDNRTSSENGTFLNPIILVPGILDESGVWFVNYPSQSPGFLLAERGYDLWAMNTREIAFRSHHETLSQKDDRYWQWSFDEIGRYDIAAVIDLVLNVTRASKVTLLVYSQGMTSSLILLSTKAEYNDKVDFLVAYGPVANITHIGFPLRELIAISGPLFLLLDPFEDSGYLYLPEAPRALTQLVCGILQGQPCSLFLSITLFTSPEELNKVVIGVHDAGGRLEITNFEDYSSRLTVRNLCALHQIAIRGKPYMFAFRQVVDVKFNTIGCDHNNTRLPVMLSHYPIGTSYQNLRHFVQINREKDFLMYNYGASENKDRYGQCELIKDFGFSCETTEATTDDGYILEVDRVGTLAKEDYKTSSENGTYRKPIILVPGILVESGSWFINYPSQSPGFLLAERGYDLWAMNTREIAFRSHHKTLSQNDDRYWQWSFDEIGRYDIAAVIDLVLNATRASKVTLLAYSQGMTSSLVLLSTKPEYNDKIDLVVAYGPVANITDIGFPLRELIAISGPLFLLLDPFGDSGYLYIPDVPRKLTQLVCGILQGQPCSLFLSVTLFTSPEELNKTRVPVMLSHYTIGTSYQNLRHFVQINREKDFLMYNYGASENKNRYGQEDPPAYDVDRITVPIALFSSEGDTIADPKDVSLLAERLGSRLLFNHVVPPKDFRHLDFTYGYHATDFLHKLMIDTIEKYADTSAQQEQR